MAQVLDLPFPRSLCPQPPAGSSRSPLASRCEFSKHFPHPFCPRPRGVPSARAGQRVRLKGPWSISPCPRPAQPAASEARHAAQPGGRRPTRRRDPPRAWLQHWGLRALSLSLPTQARATEVTAGHPGVGAGRGVLQGLEGGLGEQSDLSEV